MRSISLILSSNLFWDGEDEFISECNFSAMGINWAITESASDQMFIDL